MNTRFVSAGVLVAISLVAAAIVIAQHNQLTALADQKQKTEDASKRAPAQSESEASGQNSSLARPSAELLELRSKVTQLMARKNELAGARLENEQLQSQLSVRGTNSSALPADYIRARDAQWVGSSTVESTIQSFLWALRHRDTNALFQVLTPRSIEDLRQQLQHSSPDDFFKEASLFPGMRIAERRQLPDGSIEAKVEMLPGKPELTAFHFELIQGQWKLDMR
jgi:hypothetical protein